jgi:capsule polysaccharide modification protein KpsS
LLKKFAISIKKISLVAISFLLFFVIFDFIFSNYIFKEKLDLKYDCFEYKNHIFKGQDYHDYRLLKNCEAIEKQRTVKPYKVYTDENGYRYSKRKRQNQLVNIVFLGDSFT